MQAEVSLPSAPERDIHASGSTDSHLRIGEQVVCHLPDETPQRWMVRVEIDSRRRNSISRRPHPYRIWPASFSTDPQDTGFLR